LKLKFDGKSLKAKIGLHFILFALILMTFTWATQVLFLNTFYQTMKQNSTENLMRHIETAYGKYDTAGFINTIADMASNNDIFLYVNYIDGTPLVTTASGAPAAHHIEDINQVNEAMISENSSSVSIIIREHTEDQNTLACGRILTSPGKAALIVYAISPLFPMTSTIAILKKQLMLATGLSLVLAALLAFIISNKIN
jgi:ABC-type multidrug transport system fused ATPase/permease subunit